MTRSEFHKVLDRRVFVLDGATGTELQRRGMPLEVCPEKWALENPDVLRAIQTEYLEAGAAGIYTCTFGGNRMKLGEFGLGDQVRGMNRDLARLSREVAGERASVVGDMSPTGHLVEPFGDLAFEEVVNIYREQAQGLLDGGVDCFVVETMVDIQEARAAVLAVRDLCDRPVFVSMTFDEAGRTLTGSDPKTAALILQGVGADAVGCNCSTGPRPIRRVIEAMAEVVRVPLLALPNAGIPRLVRGETVFSLSAEEFARETAAIARTARIVGGCCGTSPAYITALSEAVSDMPAPPVLDRCPSAVCSPRHTVFFDAGQPLTVVGERINPTGKEALKEDLRKGGTAEVRRLALEQVKAGAQILDVNVGASGVDEGEAMCRAVDCLASAVDAPLCIDSSDPAGVERALRLYPGRALVNSVSGESGKADALLPVVARYGAVFIALPLDDEGIPESAADRVKIVESLAQRAGAEGLGKERMVVDGLVLAVSSDSTAAAETLRTIDWCAHSCGVATLAGLSNISFGLPARRWVNAGFLAMAAQRGLRMVIANPGDEVVMAMRRAADVLTCRDPGAELYSRHFAPSHADQAAMPPPSVDKALVPAYQAVLEGNREGVGSAIDEALDQGMPAKRIMQEGMIPAITRVGELFEKAIYFLPQLIRSAEAMRGGFERLEPLLLEAGGEPAKRTTVLLATVAGDIHDIGKSIVAVMLRNYGYDVRDLGKDIGAEEILGAAEETGAALVGLSALMTTTMGAMKTVLDQARQRGLSCQFMIGGAAVDRAYAAEIGADGYADDAYGAVKEAERLLGPAR